MAEMAHHHRHRRVSGLCGWEVGGRVFVEGEENLIRLSSLRCCIYLRGSEATIEPSAHPSNLRHSQPDLRRGHHGHPTIPAKLSPTDQRRFYASIPFHSIPRARLFHQGIPSDLVMHLCLVNANEMAYHLQILRSQLQVPYPEPLVPPQKHNSTSMVPTRVTSPHLLPAPTAQKTERHYPSMHAAMESSVRGGRTPLTTRRTRMRPA